MGGGLEIVSHDHFTWNPHGRLQQRGHHPGAVNPSVAVHDHGIVRPVFQDGKQVSKSLMEVRLVHKVAIKVEHPVSSPTMSALCETGRDLGPNRNSLVRDHPQHHLRVTGVPPLVVSSKIDDRPYSEQAQPLHQVFWRPLVEGGRSIDPSRGNPWRCGNVPPPEIFGVSLPDLVAQSNGCFPSGRAIRPAPLQLVEKELVENAQPGVALVHIFGGTQAQNLVSNSFWEFIND